VAGRVCRCGAGALDPEECRRRPDQGDSDRTARRIRVYRHTGQHGSVAPREDVRRVPESDADCGRPKARRARDCERPVARGSECKGDGPKRIAWTSDEYGCSRRSRRRRTVNPSALFIDRPLMTTLIMAGILFFRIFAYQLLPVSDLPNVDFPTILVSASLPGASPDTMASSVATPLEKQFSTIAGIDSMTSANSLGQTSITIQFNLSRGLDGAALDVQAAITAAGGQLPPEMPTPPTFQKVNPADSPILYLALSSPTMRLSDIDEAAETTIAQNVSMVNGVAQVMVYGAQKYAMRAQIDPSALASRQIGIDEVSAALQSGNTNLPTGTLYGQNHTFTILSNGQRMNALQFGPIVVAYRNGSPVRLNELGRVVDSVQNDKTASWFNGVRAIVLAIQKQPGTNTVAVVDKIKNLLPRLEEHIPAAVRVD